jgi:hypothetical protein
VQSSSNVGRRQFIQSTSAAGVGLAVMGSATAQSKTPNWIQAENARPGTASWQLTNPAEKNEISGYASVTSVALRGRIDFFVDTQDNSVTLQFYRLGWYGGLGAREVQAPVVVPGVKQPAPKIDPQTQMVECEWSKTHSLQIIDASNWLSGVYLVKLTGNTSQKQSYIHFVVRNNWRQVDHLVQCSVTTYQAYNNWGGKSLYGFNSTDGVASTAVSFNRPYGGAHGTGQFLTYELQMLRFLEREGFNVAYCTNLDVHDSATHLLRHKNFLSLGHDEYWSWDMRANVEQARDHGVNLCFFSANTCYWQVRLETSPITGDNNRTMLCYKNKDKDPYTLNPRLSHMSTVRWRQEPVNRPENALIGIMFEFYPVANQDIVITNSSHWIYNQTGLKDGDKLRFLLGYEADRIFPGSPSNLVTLANSPVPGFALPANMTLYRAASGAQIFAAGTIQWSYGLDNYNQPYTNIPVLPAAQQITRNILNAFAV